MYAAQQGLCHHRHPIACLGTLYPVGRWAQQQRRRTGEEEEERESGEPVRLEEAGRIVELQGKIGNGNEDGRRRRRKM